MRKLLVVLGLVLATSAFGQPFRALSFLSDTVSGYIATNAACANCYSQSFAGFTVTNAAAAPLGGYTNIYSWGYNGVTGTNSRPLTWTNNFGVWVIPTNGVPATDDYSRTNKIQYVTNDSTPLTRDVPLWVDRNGQLPITVISNADFTIPGTMGAAMFSPATLSCTLFGAASAATKLNLIFVGLPDGVHEPTATGALTFEWGIVPAAGTITISTNFPFWKFAGCGAVRLRSAALTTTTAANIGVTIQSLTLNGFVP